jgi:hypothetical protein
MGVWSFRMTPVVHVPCLQEGERRLGQWASKLALDVVSEHFGEEAATVCAALSGAQPTTISELVAYVQETRELGAFVWDIARATLLLMCTRAHVRTRKWGWTSVTASPGVHLHVSSTLFVVKFPNLGSAYRPSLWACTGMQTARG